jgi:translation initiation factor 1
MLYNALSMGPADKKKLDSSSATPENNVAVNTPFAALAGLRAGLPAAPPRSDAPVQIRSKAPARAVVRLEKKGRSGKEATIIEKLALPDAELQTWCKALKQALGCGGAVDGDSIVLQGDLRQRLPALLTSRGVRNVTVSGQ